MSCIKCGGHLDRLDAWLEDFFGWHFSLACADLKIRYFEEITLKGSKEFNEELLRRRINLAFKNAGVPFEFTNALICQACW